MGGTVYRPRHHALEMTPTCRSTSLAGQIVMNQRYLEESLMGHEPTTNDENLGAHTSSVPRLDGETRQARCLRSQGIFVGVVHVAQSVRLRCARKR